MKEKLEQQLVAAACRGDDEAFGSLARIYWRPLVNGVRRFVGDYHLAQDVAQEALLRAHRGVRKLDHLERFGPWILRIGRNVAVDRLRRERGRREVELLEPERVTRDDVVSEASAPDPCRGAVARRQARMWRAILCLAPRDRRLLLLRFGRGLSQRQIAQECGLTLAVVKMALYRGRARLSRMLG